MKKQIAGLIIIISLFASSCKMAGTLYPISQDQNDVILKKEMIGKWGDSKDTSGYYVVDTFSGKDGKLYQIKTIYKNI